MNHYTIVVRYDPAFFQLPSCAFFRITVILKILIQICHSYKDCLLRRQMTVRQQVRHKKTQQAE